MPITIGTNLFAVNALRQLGRSTFAYTRAMERLSSGLRINRASDDAAGLSVSSTLNSESRFFGQAYRNVNDGISALSIADGATTQLSDILIRLKELAEMGANGTYSTSQRRQLDNEAQQLRAEYNRIIDTTTFNGIKLIDENTRAIGIATGPSGANGILTLNSSNLRTGNKGTGVFSDGVIVGGTGNGISSSVSVDLNEDGKQDLVFGDTVGSSHGLYVQYGNGDGTFQTEQLIAGTQGLLTVAEVRLNDVNGDGLLDITAVGTSATGQSVCSVI